MVSAKKASRDGRLNYWGDIMSHGKRRLFYHSQPWKKARAAYLAYRKAIDGGLCEVCRDQLGDTVHHKTWLTEDNVDNPDISLSFSNFCLICRDCHAKEKDPDRKSPGRYTFDDDGNLIRTEET